MEEKLLIAFISAVFGAVIGRFIWKKPEWERYQDDRSEKMINISNKINDLSSNAEKKQEMLLKIEEFSYLVLLKRIPIEHAMLFADIVFNLTDDSYKLLLKQDNSEQKINEEFFKRYNIIISCSKKLQRYRYFYNFCGIKIYSLLRNLKHTSRRSRES